MNIFKMIIISLFLSFLSVACATPQRPLRVVEIVEYTHRECVDSRPGACDEFMARPVATPLIDLDLVLPPPTSPSFPWYGKLGAATLCGGLGALGGYEASRAIQKGQQAGPNFSYSTGTEIIGASVGGVVSALACWGVTEAIESFGGGE